MIDLYRRYDLAELKRKLYNLKDILQKLVKKPKLLQSVKKLELSEFIEITNFLSPIIIRILDFRINIFYIVKLANRLREILANFRKKLSSKNYKILQRNRKRQSTYIDFDIRIRLYRNYKLPKLEKRLYSLKRISKGPILEVELSYIRSRFSDIISARNESTQSKGIQNRD